MIPTDVHMLRGIVALERAQLHLQVEDVEKAYLSIEEGIEHIRKALAS